MDVPEEAVAVEEVRHVIQGLYLINYSRVFDLRLDLVFFYKFVA